MASAPRQPFWKSKRLEELTEAEWESLCDGCGRCCLNKLEDWDTGEIYWTDIACRLLDTHQCRCRDYENRFAQVPDCLRVDLEAVRNLSWLPPTCAYRLIGEGRELYDWHHLVSGSRETVHLAGISVRGQVLSEEGIEPEDYENHLASWPGQNPMAEENSQK